MFTKTIQFLENCVTIFISARNKLIKETMKTAQQFNPTSFDTLPRDITALYNYASDLTCELPESTRELKMVRNLMTALETGEYTRTVDGQSWTNYEATTERLAQSRIELAGAGLTDADMMQTSWRSMMHPFCNQRDSLLVLHATNTISTDGARRASQAINAINAAQSN